MQILYTHISQRKPWHRERKISYSNCICLQQLKCHFTFPLRPRQRQTLCLFSFRVVLIIIITFVVCFPIHLPFHFLISCHTTILCSSLQFSIQPNQCLWCFSVSCVTPTELLIELLFSLFILISSHINSLIRIP